jgi:CRISPR-associated protein Csh1
MFHSLLRIGELQIGKTEGSVTLPIVAIDKKDATLGLVVFDNRSKSVYIKKEKLAEGDEEKYAHIGNAKAQKPQDRITTGNLEYILGYKKDSTKVRNNKFALKVIADKLSNSETGKLLNEVLSWYSPDVKVDNLDWDCDLYTVRIIDKNGKEIDIATLPDYRTSLVEGMTTVKGKCQFCGSDNVLPNPDYTGGSMLKIFIVDKKGFLSNFGDILESHTICPSCRHKLELGNNYVEQNLSVRIGKLNAYVIPDLPPKADVTFLQRFKTDQDGSYILEGLREIEKGERETLDIMEFEGVEVRLDLVFGQKQQNKFRLWRIIPEVGVPRLVHVMRLAGRGKAIVSATYDNKIDLKDVSFSTLYGILPVRELSKGIDPSVFLDFLEAILLGNKLDPNYVYNSFLSVIRCLRYDTCSNSLTRFSLEDLLLYQEIFIYVMRQLGIMGEDTLNMERTKVSNIDSYIGSLGIKGGLKGLFLLGVLTAYVGKEQHNKGDNKKAILNRIDYEGMDINDIVTYANRLHESLRDYRQLNSTTESLFAEALESIKKNPNDLWDTAANVFHILLGYSYQTKQFIMHGEPQTKQPTANQEESAE